MQKIAPQPGPQTEFLSSKADIVIYGGAAGGGKSYGLLLEGMRYTYVPGFNSVIFRLTYGDVTNPGGLWDESFELYPLAGGRPRRSALRWEWQNSVVMFSHFQHPKYKMNWQGSQICMIGWDELTHFSQDIFFYMLSRNRSTCGVRPYIRCTCNPDPDSWVKEFISWWLDDETGYPIPERSGVIRWFIRVQGMVEWYDAPEKIPKELRETAKTCTFIAANLKDNPALTRKDPHYLANLMALPTHERERLLGGNWNIRLAAGMYFKRGWFEIIEETWPDGRVVRYWDRAATEPNEQNTNPDWTVGVKMRKALNGLYIVEDVVRFRGRPRQVRETIRNTASQDGIECTVVLEEDPGQAGKADIDTLRSHLDGYHVEVNRVDKAKEVRARPVSSAAEQGRVKLIRGDWNRIFLNELEQFPPEKNSGGHDDQVDSLSGAYNYLSLAMPSPRIRLVRM